MSAELLNIRYKTTVESYLLYYATYMKGSAIAKRSVKSPLYFFITLFCGLLFCAGVLLFQGSGVLSSVFPYLQDNILSWFGTIFLMGSMFGMGGYILIHKSLYAKHVQHIARALVDRGLTHDLTIGETGIHCKTEWTDATTLWIGVERVYTAKDVVVIILKPDNGLPIPFSAFQSAAHREAFIAYINGKIGG